MPPAVKVPSNIEFPFCMVRGKELKEIMKAFIDTGSAKGRSSGVPILCHYADEHRDTACSTTEAAKIRCQEVAKSSGYTDIQGQPVALYCNFFSIPDSSKDTSPVANIFFCCDKDKKVKSRVEEG